MISVNLRTVQGYKKDRFIYLILIFIGYGIFLIFQNIF